MIRRIVFLLLLVLFIIANMICAIKGLAGLDVQAESISCARTNSMFAAIFAFFAWQKK